jgi:hypothetical protein
MNRTINARVTGPPARKPTDLEKIHAWLARRRDPFPPTTWEAMQALNDPPKKPLHVPGLPQPDPRPRLTIKEAMGTAPRGGIGSR